MIAKDEDALICDFAQFYNVYEYRGLPVKTSAALAFGLPQDSRSKMILAGRKATTEELLMGLIADRLGILIWQRSEDGKKGINKPKSIFDEMMHGKPKDQYMAFDGPEAYEAARAKIRGD